MPITSARYGRPKGTGVDDTRHLESLAALLAANPALKPTTAIRSLGVEDPSVIRRLRDKFRMDQARLMADSRTTLRSHAHPDPLRLNSRRPLASVRTQFPASSIATPNETIPAAAPALPERPLLAVCYDFGLWAAGTAIEQQMVLAKHWLQLPAFEIAMRGQLAIGAFVVAASTPRKPMKPRIH
jgi:hypothetical protein